MVIESGILKHFCCAWFHPMTRALEAVAPMTPGTMSHSTARQARCPRHFTRSPWQLNGANHLTPSSFGIGTELQGFPVQSRHQSVAPIDEISVPLRPPLKCADLATHSLVLELLLSDCLNDFINFRRPTDRPTIRPKRRM